MKILFIALSMLAAISYGDSNVTRSERFDRIEKVFNELRKDNMHILDDFYDENLKFEDPISEINGLNEMKQYYMNMYNSVTEIRFDFTDNFEKGDTHVVFWDMTLKASSMLNGGKAFTVKGNSYITFGENNKVIYHRDYFDAGAMLYEKLPGIGFIIKKIKAQFH